MVFAQGHLPSLWWSDSDLATNHAFVGEIKGVNRGTWAHLSRYYRTNIDHFYGGIHIPFDGGSFPHFHHHTLGIGDHDDSEGRTYYGIPQKID